MITASQCRAARGLLDWTQQELADAARIGVATVRLFESEATETRQATLAAESRDPEDVRPDRAKGGSGLFEKNVRVLITEDAAIAAVIMPLLQAPQVARGNCAALDRRLIRLVQGRCDLSHAHDDARDWSYHRRRLCRCAREG
jgi:transcriptional regulator with XRE-family HTH domain